MAISAGDFKTGLTLIVDGDPWVVLDFQHVKPGKGAAILKTKMKNLKTGNTLLSEVCLIFQTFVMQMLRLNNIFKIYLTLFNSKTS